MARFRAAAVSARDSIAVSPLRPAPASVPAAATAATGPASGPYLGAAEGEVRHRISFSVRGDRFRNLRVDGRDMAPSARIADGRVVCGHLGFEMTAEWIDADHVEGTVKMRGRWARPVSFRFSARRRVGDVLSG
jgi:hypothetical protein